MNSRCPLFVHALHRVARGVRRRARRGLCRARPVDEPPPKRRPGDERERGYCERRARHRASSTMRDRLVNPLTENARQCDPRSPQRPGATRRFPRVSESAGLGRPVLPIWPAIPSSAHALARRCSPPCRMFYAERHAGRSHAARGRPGLERRRWRGAARFRRPHRCRFASLRC
jgi:hypothetical protein